MPPTNAGGSVAVDSWKHDGCEEQRAVLSAAGTRLDRPVMEDPGRTECKPGKGVARLQTGCGSLRWSRAPVRRVCPTEPCTLQSFEWFQ
jgi:hypothetical protein